MIKENRISVIEKRIKMWKRVGLIVLAVLLFVFCVFSSIVPMDTWKYHFGLPNIRPRAQGEMRMHFLNVGEGDCAIIELPDGQVMMVDGGNGAESTSTTIMRYLNALKIDTIDYMLLTHADSDHCGALDTVLKYKTVKKAYIVKTSSKINQEYAEVYDCLTKENCEMAYATRGEIITSKRADFPYTLTVLWPYTSDLEGIDQIYNETNRLSTVFWLDYFGTSALFTGDAPKAVEVDLLRDAEFGFLNTYGIDLGSTEILKVAHHGSEDASHLEFLSYLGVKDAVISCSRSNLYGHPSMEVCNRLQAVGAKEYRTYEGHVMITATKEGTYKVERVG